MLLLLMVMNFVCVLKAQDKGLKIPDGTSTVIPYGWTAKSGKSHSELLSPEGDLLIRFVSMPTLGKFDDDIAAAWKIVDSDFSLKPLTKAKPPTKEGWEAIYQIVYDTPTSASKTVVAILRSLKGRAYINLVSGSNATLGKRGAQLAQSIDGWKPQGLVEADLLKVEAAAWSNAQKVSFEKFIQKALKEFKVPGASVGIVQNGKLVYAQGFGVRDTQSKSPVTSKTRFMIGSTSKPLTTLLMAKLVDEKKLSWDAPLSSLLKGFSLADPEFSKKLQLRHSACACTGMPRQDLNFIFKYSGITPEQRLEQMKMMSPTTGLGETFQYSNWLVAAGGYAAARAFDTEGNLESAYARAMKEVVFSPLGMNNTMLRSSEAIKGESARPHGFDFNDQVQAMPLGMEDAVYSVAPAGAVWSTVEDLSKYLQMELSGGMVASKTRYMSQESLLKRREKGVKIDGTSYYGLGLFIEKEQGLEIFGHGGNTLGFSSDLFFIPEKQVGVVVLSNLAGANRFLGAVKQRFLELEFGAAPNAEKLVKFGIERRNEGTKKLHESVTLDPMKNAWIEGLVGDYENTDLGSARVFKMNNTYQIVFSEWTSDLATKLESNGERLLALVSPPWGGGLELMVSLENKILIIDDGQHKYEFRRK